MPRLLEMSGICKQFPGVVALDDVDFVVQSGEVHALLGENGAGKSTLIKVLAGLYTPDAGEVTFRGERLNGLPPQGILERGMGFIHQERVYIPYFTVGQMLFLGNEPKSRSGLIDWNELYAQSHTALSSLLGLDIDPRRPMQSLTVSEKQLVDITKILMTDPALIVLDEPTGPLSEEEADRLFAIIRQLKQQGVTFIYVSHRLDEIFKICDTATVLKDGKHVKTTRVAEITADEIVNMMVGRRLEDQFPKSAVPIGDVVFEASRLKSGNHVRDVSFNVRSGEILGIYGLVGAGRTETVRLVFGADHKEAGEIRIDGRAAQINSPRDAVSAGIALVPEDRRGQGVTVGMSVKENISLASLAKFARGGLLRLKEEEKSAAGFVESLSIKTPTIDQLVKYLSGGNQQKVVLAKWMCSKARVFIFDQPTIGVDVGAKAEIYRLIGDLASKGAAIVLVSSELPEVLGLCDRILVMYKGRITAELSRDEATPDRLLFYAMGGGAVDA